MRISPVSMYSYYNAPKFTSCKEQPPVELDIPEEEQPEDFAVPPNTLTSKLLAEDPINFKQFYYTRELDYPVKRDVMAEIPIQSRKTRQWETAQVIRSNGTGEEFYPCYERMYYIRKGDEDLALLQVSKGIDECVEILFLSNAVGRKEYRHLETKLLQALGEDCINEGFIPTIKFLTPQQRDFGEISLDRGLLYKQLGAVKSDDPYSYEMVFEQNQFIRFFKKVAEDNAFIMPKTKKNFEKLLKKQQV